MIGGCGVYRNNKGFTLIELLGVIIILSIILLIAVPNISSILDRSKRDTYIADAKKFVSLVEYELRKGNINKPSSTELYKITLSYLATNDIEKDPDGNIYDVDESYVVVARKDGYLVYYVNLVSTDSKGKTKGILLINVDDLDGDDKYQKIKTEFTALTDSEIINKVGVAGTLKKF